MITYKNEMKIEFNLFYQYVERVFDIFPILFFCLIFDGCLFEHKHMTIFITIYQIEYFYFPHFSNIQFLDLIWVTVDSSLGLFLFDE